MKNTKQNPRRDLILILKALACELHTLACEIENFDTIENVKTRAGNMGTLLLTLRNAAWEVQQNRFAKAGEYLQEIQGELQQDFTTEIEPQLPKLA